MIANLPLLFANGNPTALSKITAGELEKFITFMVTCSWGHDTAKDIIQPPWWPEDVAFTHPFKKPQDISKDWETKLKQLVRKCYNYHKSEFLLLFSAQLARYPRKRLRYVDNRDHTTSLYYIPTGRLLVTFRNENLFYDCKIIPNSGPTRAEPQLKTADIYLCDNCDSHFDNLDVLRSHERLCNNEVPSSTDITSGSLQEFLTALKLRSVSDANENTPINASEGRTRQIRSAANIDRGPPYPFSSLAYMRNVKPNPHWDASHSRERVERYCTNLPSFSAKPLGNKSKNNQFAVRYRRPIDFWHRKHTFPNQRHKEILDLKGQLLFLKCRPLVVKMKRMSMKSMEEYINKLKEESLLKNAHVIDKDIEFVGDYEADGVMDVDAVKIVDPLTRVGDAKSDEIIDLCSDDESPTTNENCDPRAGVTCVIRGGAVLRRTATTPSALPDEPCGARHRPMLPAVLQPHSVILFRQSSSNYHTISID